MAREPVYSYEEIADFFGTYARNLQNLRGNVMGIARSRAIRERTNLSAGDNLRESERQLEKINDLFDSMFAPLAAYRWHAKTLFYQEPSRGTTRELSVIENVTIGAANKCRIGPAGWNGDTASVPDIRPFERPYEMLPTFLAVAFGVDSGRWGNMFWPENADPYTGGDQVLISGTGTAADGYRIINDVDPEGRWIELMSVPGSPPDDSPVAVTDMRITVEQRDFRGHMTIRVPDLVGMFDYEAQQALNKVGLVGTAVWVTSAQPYRLVIAQDPAPNTMVSFGTHITLDISDGEG